MIPLEPMWKELKRVIKPRGAIVMTASQPFTSALVMSNAKWFRYELVWEKSKATGHLDAKRKPMKAHENVLVFCDGAAPYFPQMNAGKPYKEYGGKKVTEVYGTVRDQHFRNPNDGERFPRSTVYFKSAESEGEHLHPTQKPVALMRYLIRTYTNPSALVLDFCMGSGTCGVACQIENRDFIGIERDASYFAIAQRRIHEASPDVVAPLFAGVDL